MKKLSLALAGSLMSLMIASSASAANTALLENLARNIVLKTYQDMATYAADLRDKVATMQQSPTQANLDAAQQAWRQVRVPWEGSEAFIFGPVEALGIDPMIDTWPLNKADLDGVLASNMNLTPAFIRSIGTNLQGFHTAEYLLFGSGETAIPKNIGQMTSRELQYLSAVTVVLADHCADLALAWSTNYNPDEPSTPGYVDIISKPSLRNPVYRSEIAVYSEYVRGMLAIIDEVGSGKLAEPLGDSIANANVSAVESPFSWNSLTDFTNNIRSVLSIYNGEYMGVKTGPGIKDLVAAKNPQLANQVEQRIHQAMQKIQDIAGPNKLDFREAIVDEAGRARTRAAVDDLKSLYNLVNNQVLPIVEN